MAIHVTEQLRTFLLSILLGLGAGVLYDLLRAQDEKEAQYIATALEIYVTGGPAAAPPTDGAAGPALLSGRRSGGLSVRPAAVGWPAPGVHPAGRSGRRRSVFFPAFPAPAAGLGLLDGPVDGIVPISESTGTVLRRSL